MPIYEYRCGNGHKFEVMQRMADDSLTACTICGAPVQRVFHPVAVHFKGKGFYATDYGKANAGGDGKAESGADSEPAKSGADSKSGESSSDSGSGSTDGGSSKEAGSGSQKSSTKPAATE
jgi:putative FmdB family regulatory protein